MTSLCKPNSCLVCMKVVSKNVSAIQCSGCDAWVHLKCDNTVSLAAYRALQDHPSPAIIYLCPSCMKPRGLIRTVRDGERVSTHVQTNPQDATRTDAYSQTIPHNEGQSSTHTQTNQIFSHTVGTSPVKPNSKTARLERPQVANTDPTSAPNQPRPAKKTLKMLLTTSHITQPHAHSSNVPVNNGVLVTKRMSPLTDQQPPDPQRTLDKGVGTPSPSQATHHRTTSVILFGVPESTSALLSDRATHDSGVWGEISQLLGMGPVKPVSLRRLVGNPSTVPSPRPLRAEFTSSSQAESAILLAKHLEGTHLSQVRIRADLPKSNRGPDLSNRLERQIIIRGVPEGSDPETQRDHDRLQWAYIAQRISVPNILATDVARLPRPAHLSNLNQPRLLRVTLLTSSMATQILDRWSNARNTLPENVRIHPCRSRDQRITRRQELPIEPSAPALELTPILSIPQHNDRDLPSTPQCIEIPKNGDLPAQ